MRTQLLEALQNDWGPLQGCQCKTLEPVGSASTWRGRAAAFFFFAFLRLGLGLAQVQLGVEQAQMRLGLGQAGPNSICPLAHNICKEKPEKKSKLGQAA